MLLNGARVGALILSLLVCALTGNFQSLSWLWALPLAYVGFEVLLLVLGFLFLIFICSLVDITVPQEKESKFYRIALNLYVEAALDLLQTRIHSRGFEKMPESGRFLVVCNHLSVMDPVLITRFFSKKQIAFISKKENMDMWLVGKMMHRTMCQMLDRDNDRAALRTIIRCIQLIREDQASIAVFPEGYTSRDGRLQHFRSGVFKIALKAKVPIVVCTLQNTQKILPSAAKLRNVHVHIHLVDVIYPEQFAGKTAIQIGSEVHQMMLDDLGPDFAPETQPETADNT